jgi:hypothetical protein
MRQRKPIPICGSTQLAKVRRRNGVASVLAMMYLVLLAVVAIGFYAATGTNAQVSHNERHRTEALAAAESGMDFIRYHLAQVVIPPLVAESNILVEIHKDLKAELEGTSNLRDMKVALNSGGTGGTTSIEIPEGREQYITLANSGTKFRIQITRPSGRDVVVKVIGCRSDTSRARTDRAAVQLTYRPDEHPTEFFENGMAARGAVTLDSKNAIKGTPAEMASILTTTTVNPPVNVMTGSISGDITVLDGLNPTLASGVSVGGTTNHAEILANHVNHIDSTVLPEFPTPDTSIFKRFATNTYVSGSSTYTNIIVPPNTNPTFSGPITLRGVIYIQQPNVCKFGGNCTIQGIIVTENIGVGTLLSNSLTFTGSGNTHSGLETLPADDPQFAELRLMGGSFVIAPGFDLKMTGNFSAISGNIVADRINVQGSADLAVSGSIVALKNTLTLGTNGVISFQSNPTGGLHSGLRFSDKYVPRLNTYDEVKP